MKQSIWKRISASATALLLLTAMAVPAVQGAPAEKEGRTLATDYIAGDLRFSSRDLSLYQYDGEDLPAANEALPEKLDLRDEGYVTSVKNQMPWGACWAFGALAASESNLMRNGTSNPDLSERHLAWYLYQPIQTGSQAGEGIKLLKDYNNELDQGGNPNKAVSILSSWQGAASEADAPYQNNEGTDDKNGDWSLPESKRFHSVAHLTNADYLPSPSSYGGDFELDESGNLPPYEYNESGTVAIKEALMKTGVVTIAYHADVSKPDEATGNSAYFNYDNWAQCVDEFIMFGAGSTMPNHGVSIVGWDDSYAVENFNEAHRPEQPGAWIVKNSWGTKETRPDKVWGIDGSGYFYLSYYDQTIMMPTSLELDSEDSGFDYDNNYQYDYMGASFSLNAKSAQKVSASNVFTATGYEELGAVSATTNAANSTVEVKVYRLNEGAAAADDGELVAAGRDSFAYSGFHTVALSQPVKLSKDERFSVVETIIDEQGNYYVSYEAAPKDAQAGYAADGSAEEGLVQYTVKSNKGESFVWSEEDGWEDFKEVSSVFADKTIMNTGNIMIKAFTKNADVTVPQLIKLQVSSYDKTGSLLGETQEITPSAAAEITLPSYTDHVVMVPVLNDPQGNAELTVSGRTFAVNEDIPRSVLKTGAQVTVTTLADTEGYQGSSYRFTVKALDDTVLSSGGVTMVDSEGALPQGVEFTVAQATQGADFNAVRDALKQEGRDEAFTLLSIETVYDGEKFVLENGEGVDLLFDLPGGYDKSATQLYRVEFTGGKAVLVPVTEEENESLALNTSFINSYYVLAQKNLQPVTPTQPEEKPDPATPGDADTNNGQNGEGKAPQTGDLSAPMLWALLAVLSGGAIVCAHRKKRKTVR